MTDTATTTPVLDHVRIVNGGVLELVTVRTVLDEMNLAQMSGRDSVREMSAKGSTARIVYTTGETVDLRPATDADRRLVAVQVWSLSEHMAQSLVRAAVNGGGYYAKNLVNGGGTGGALLRRGLIEHRTTGTWDSAYYVTLAGQAVAASLR